MIKFLTSLILIFSSISILPAQDEAAAKEEVRGRSARFIYTSLPEGIDNPALVMSGKEIAEITLSKRSPSTPVKIPADGIIKLIKKIPNQADPTKPTYQTLAQALIAEDVKDALVILVPSAKVTSGVVFQTRVKDLSKFKNGNSMYVNMTNLKVGVELGKTS
jgi:hypothetical protein